MRSRTSRRATRSVSAPCAACLRSEARMDDQLSHVDEHGAARMVNVGDKAVTHRRAVAAAFLEARPETVALVVEGNVPKGDVLAAGRLAGIMAAKRTSDIIPLCHPLAITHAQVAIEPISSDSGASGGPGVRTGFAIKATVEVAGQTGVEMEAL